VRVERFALEGSEDLVARAREELLARGSAGPGSSFEWGYLLGVEEDERAELPAAAQLDRLLRESVVAAVERESGRRYGLSFLKAARGVPPAASEGVHYAGFHLDTHPEIRDETGVELARVLINLAGTPRRLRYADTDRFALSALGLPIHRGDHQVVDLPEKIEVRTIEIPPAGEGALHGLRFWASVVPHVGADDEHGHFLASYEAVAPYVGAA
jgi:hypothetical protein